LILFIGVGLYFTIPENLALGKTFPYVFITAGNFTLGEPPPYGSFSTAVLLLIYAFTGFENASVPAGEIVNPRRNMPFAILIGIAIVTAFYLLIQTVCIGTLPNLGGTERPLAEAAGMFLGPLGASIIAAGAITSIIGNLNVAILTTPRILFAMATHRELPQSLGEVHSRFRTPHIAILITAGLMLALTLSSSVIYALTVSTIARLLAYAATCVALPKLRRAKDVQPALVSIPGGVVVSALAVLLTVWLLSNSTLREARDAAIGVVVGLVIYFAYRFSRRHVAASADPTLQEE
jgi:amino acid transporter